MTSHIQEARLLAAALIRPEGQELQDTIHMLLLEMQRLPATSFCIVRRGHFGPAFRTTVNGYKAFDALPQKSSVRWYFSTWPRRYEKFSKRRFAHRFPDFEIGERNCDEDWSVALTTVAEARAVLEFCSEGLSDVATKPS